MKNIIGIICVVVLLIGCGQPGSHESASQPQQTEQQTFKNSEDFLKEGVAYLKTTNPSVAIKSFDEAIRREPNNPRGYIILGQTYLRIGDYDRAIDTFTAALRPAPNSGEVYFYLATTFHLNGNNEQAFENIQKSIALFQQADDQESMQKSLVLFKTVVSQLKAAEGASVPDVEVPGMDSSDGLVQEMEIPEIN